MKEQASALELLDQIETFKPKRRFLQSWDRASRVLRYGCGDDKNGVVVGSDGSLEVCPPSASTKLASATVKSFLAGEHVTNPFLDTAAILKEHLFLPDERLYTLFSAWVAGSYFYSMFSHYGYLFLFSDQPRCGKTRAEELVSLLAFEAHMSSTAPSCMTLTTARSGFQISAARSVSPSRSMRA